MPLSPLSMLLALVAGITMAFQGSLNAILGKAVGLLEATFVVHLVGTVTVVIVLMLSRLGKTGLDQIGQAPWYAVLGGALSVLIIYAVVASISKLGVASATTLIILGQISAAVLIDHFGVFGLRQIPFTWWKFAGIALLATGAKLMLNTNH